MLAEFSADTNYRQMDTDSMLDKYTSESWEYARGYSHVLGSIPSSFSSVIRTLMGEHSSGAEMTAGKSRYFVERLFKSKSLLAPFQFAAKTLTQGVDHNPKDPVLTVLQNFSPFDLATILGVVYITRRAKSVCEPDELRFVLDPMFENSVAALAIGKAIPSIGCATAILEATARPLGLMCFIKHDQKGFKEYRRGLKSTGLKAPASWDLEQEFGRWGCTSIQIGAAFIQGLGLGISRSNGFCNAFSTKTEIGNQEEISAARDFRMAAIWREALLTTRLAPSIGLPPKYYPTAEALSTANSVISYGKSNPNCLSWLERGKDDIEGGSSSKDESEVEEIAAELAKS